MVKGIKDEGHIIDFAENGNDGLQFALKGVYDVIIMDRQLRSIDGLTIIKTLRASNIQTPILILSSLFDIDERVEGLKAGGDDYLVKPFVFSELLARLEVLSKRVTLSQELTVFKIADLEMDLLTRVVKRADKKIELKTKEFQLLEYLLKNKETIVSRNMILEHA